MTEQELRAIVREVVSRYSAGHGAPPPGASVSVPAAPGAAVRSHSSHTMFVLTDDPEGRCVIEPAVPCTHCGYCKSYGH